MGYPVNFEIQSSGGLAIPRDIEAERDDTSSKAAAMADAIRKLHKVNSVDRRILARNDDSVIVEFELLSPYAGGWNIEGRCRLVIY